MLAKLMGPPGLANAVHLARGFLHTSVPSPGDFSYTLRFSLICELPGNEIRC